MGKSKTMRVKIKESFWNFQFGLGLWIIHKLQKLNDSTLMVPKEVLKSQKIEDFDGWYKWALVNKFIKQSFAVIGSIPLCLLGILAYPFLVRHAAQFLHLSTLSTGDKNFENTIHNLQKSYEEIKKARLTSRWYPRSEETKDDKYALSLLHDPYVLSGSLVLVAPLLLLGMMESKIEAWSNKLKNKKNKVSVVKFLWDAKKKHNGSIAMDEEMSEYLSNIRQTKRGQYLNAILLSAFIPIGVRILWLVNVSIIGFLTLSIAAMVFFGFWLYPLSSTIYHWVRTGYFLIRSQRANLFKNSHVLNMEDFWKFNKSVKHVNFLGSSVKGALGEILNNDRQTPLMKEAQDLMKEVVDFSWEKDGRLESQLVSDFVEKGYYIALDEPIAKKAVAIDSVYTSLLMCLTAGIVARLDDSPISDDDVYSGTLKDNYEFWRDYITPACIKPIGLDKWQISALMFTMHPSFHQLSWGSNGAGHKNPKVKSWSWAKEDEVSTGNLKLFALKKGKRRAWLDGSSMFDNQDVLSGRWGAKKLMLRVIQTIWSNWCHENDERKVFNNSSDVNQDSIDLKALTGSSASGWSSAVTGRANATEEFLSLIQICHLVATFKQMSKIGCATQFGSETQRVEREFVKECLLWLTKADRFFVSNCNADPLSKKILEANSKEIVEMLSWCTKQLSLHEKKQLEVFDILTGSVKDVLDIECKLDERINREPFGKLNGQFIEKNKAISGYEQIIMDLTLNSPRIFASDVVGKDSSSGTVESLLLNNESQEVEEVRPVVKKARRL